MTEASDSLRAQIAREIDALGGGDDAYPWRWITAMAAADRILKLVEADAVGAREEGRRAGIEEALEAMDRDDTSFQAVLTDIGIHGDTSGDAGREAGSLEA